MNKNCIRWNSSGIEVTIGIIAVSIIAIVALIVLKGDAKDIAIAIGGGLVGWLGKGVQAKDEPNQEPMEEIPNKVQAPGFGQK